MIKAGEKLKEARLEKGISLEKVSKATKIKEEFLELIEKGEYKKLPSASYAQGFVRNYAEFVGLNEEEIMAIFRREFDEDRAYRVLPKGFETDEFPVTKLRFGRAFYLSLFLLALFAGFLLYQYRYSFLNPSLTIISPKDMSTVNSSSLRVIGKTDPNSTVYINSDLVSLDSSGNFTKTITVFPGIAVIDVKVVNKFERQTEKKIQVEVK